jgi:hypothetical protein
MSSLAAVAWVLVDTCLTCTSTAIINSSYDLPNDTSRLRLTGLIGNNEFWADFSWRGCTRGRLVYNPSVPRFYPPLSCSPSSQASNRKNPAHEGDINTNVDRNYGPGLRNPKKARLFYLAHLRIYPKEHGRIRPIACSTGLLDFIISGYFTSSTSFSGYFTSSTKFGQRQVPVTRAKPVGLTTEPQKR